MKYTYKFHTIKNNPEDKGTLTFEVIEDNVGPLSGIFLDINSQDLKDWYLDGINNVLSGKSEHEERCGEIICLNIKKDKTEVTNELDENARGWIETLELRELIEIWWAEFQKFHTK